jgi:hypothetical protein
VSEVEEPLPTGALPIAVGPSLALGRAITDVAHVDYSAPNRVVVPGVPAKNERASVRALVEFCRAVRKKLSPEA